MNMFLTFFQEDHEHDGAARAGTASESTIDVDLTMVSRSVARLRKASVISYRGATSLYTVKTGDSTWLSSRIMESRDHAGANQVD
jgi:hypothetical protein